MKASREEGKVLEELLERTGSPAGPGCALAVTRGDQVDFAKTIGLASLEQGVAVGRTTAFHAASVSKQFTALAVLKLIERGEFAMESTLHDLLPEFPDYAKDVQLYHLLTHTSGLREQWDLLLAGGWSLQDVISRDDVRRVIYAQTALSFPVGSEMIYCNSGYSLLADIVERASGLSFREFCAREIFRPCGMERTLFRDDHREVVPEGAHGYEPIGTSSGYRRVPLNYGSVGATCLWTTIDDMALWLRIALDEKSEFAASLGQMQAAARLKDGSPIPYGFGLKVLEHRGLTVVGHDGSDGAFRACVLWVPAESLGVALLSNSSGVDPLAIALAALDATMGIDPVLRASPKSGDAVEIDVLRASESSAKDFCGDFWNAELSAKYQIRDDSRIGLVVDHIRHGPATLVARDVDCFDGPNWLPDLRFVRDERGRVTGFELWTKRLRSLWFRRF